MSADDPTLDTLFCNAVEIGSAEDRAAYLDRACGSDLEPLAGGREAGEYCRSLAAARVIVQRSFRRCTLSERNPPDGPGSPLGLTPCAPPPTAGRPRATG